MLKKLTLCIALSAASLATATITIDLILNVNEIESNYQRHIQSTVTLENDESIVLDHNEILVQLTASEEDEEAVTISSSIIKLDDQDEESDNEENNALATLLAQPVIRATWNQPASITLGNEEGDLLELTLIAHRE